MPGQPHDLEATRDDTNHLAAQAARYSDAGRAVFIEDNVTRVSTPQMCKQRLEQQSHAPMILNTLISAVYPLALFPLLDLGEVDLFIYA